MNAGYRMFIYFPVKKCCSLAVLLLTILTLVGGSCYTKIHKPGDELRTHCQDDFDKTWHAVDSSWTNSQCLRCSCSGCCSLAGRPTDVPEDCVAELDSKICEYKVYKKSDPSVNCPVFMFVGK